MVIDFGDDLRVEYGRSEFSQLKQAWCTTVHKFQGSQVPNVIFVASNAQYIMASRELYYTAITRASKRCVLVGDLAMLQIASKKSISKKRHTSLAGFIREFITKQVELRYFHCPYQDDTFVWDGLVAEKQSVQVPAGEAKTV